VVSVLAEVHPDGLGLPQWRGEKLTAAVGAEVEVQFARLERLEIKVPGRLHGGNGVGHLFQVIFIEIRLADLFRIKRCGDFNVGDESFITNRAPAPVARVMNHAGKPSAETAGKCVSLILNGRVHDWTRLGIASCSRLNPLQRFNQKQLWEGSVLVSVFPQQECVEKDQHVNLNAIKQIDVEM
jgi:hypothetical protein